MRINVLAFSITFALFWAVSVLFVATANAIWPPYGNAFLALVASLYPGYHPTPTAGSIMTATVYGFVDAGIGGALFAWIYNWVAEATR